jgi:tetratricopeptide (TPR) repeat protein/transcriptional regulator with XRE-family HTH domain
MTPGSLTELASMLREQRLAAMLTQEELARRAGVSVGTIAGLENGRSQRPRVSSLRALADALGLAEERRSALLAAAHPTPPARPGAATQPDMAETRPRTPAPPVGAPDTAESTRLPPCLATFTGRTDYLDRLDALVDPYGQRRAHLVTISGTAGVGKTALAIAWAHRIRDRFPDGQLHLDLRGFGPSGLPTRADEALRHLLHGLGLEPLRQPTTSDARLARYHELVADRRLLIVLDNVRDAQQVRPLVPMAAGCLMVVVSRNQLTSLVVADGAQPVALDVLSAAEARDLLTVRLGVARAAAEPAAVDAIIDQCSRLPLALALLAAKAATYPHFSLADLSRQLRDTSQSLDALSLGDADTTIRTVFSWSYETLSDGAGRLFRLLGAYCGAGFTAAAAASLAGVPRSGIAVLLGELTRAHLVTEATAGRYGIHDLLAGYALDLSQTHDPEPAREAAVLRLQHHYLHSAHAAHTLLETCTNPIEPVAAPAGVTTEALADRTAAAVWFETERAALVAAVGDAFDRGRDELTWQLAWSMHRFLGWAGHWAERLDTLRTGLAATDRLGDLAAQARIHRALSLALTRIGNHVEALPHCRAALDLSTALNDQPAVADAEQDHAFVLEQQGRLHEALTHARRAVAARRAGTDRQAHARSLNIAGWLHAQIGEYEPALEHCEAALALLGQTGNHIDRAYTSDSIGFVYQQQGDHDRAVPWFEQAVDLLGGVGDRLDAAGMLDRLGQSRHAIGDHHGARDAWLLALPVYEARQNLAAGRIREQLAAVQPHHRDRRSATTEPEVSGVPTSAA